jgi:alkylation response protein AidB-like acyl-CoA dehydrogenase
MLLGNSILRHGTAAQQAAFLPLIRAGKMRFCLGYSEPEAGSDLASLRTRAQRDGAGWLINGQKLWTTGGHLASHVWLATRTDPGATPPHAGITVFLVPMDTPGITVRQHRALSGEVSCTVFYDDVRVPDAARVGEVNGGWKVITDALAGERVVMGGIAASLHRQLDDLLDFVRADPAATVGPRGSAARAKLGELAVTLQANRALVAAAIGATAAGGGARLEAPMAGVLGGELAESFGEAMLDILGPPGALSGEVPGTPGGGAFEYGLRLSIMYVVGGGTNDVQRGLIARGLGLPR